MTNPYAPPSTRDDRRSDWPVFPLLELATAVVIGRSVYLFVMVGSVEGAMCLFVVALLAIFAMGRRG